MIEFNSNWAEFKPLNPDIPEDLEKFKQHMLTAMQFRKEPVVETPGCIIIHYDEFGMFSKPRFSGDYIALAVPCPEAGRDKNYRDFCAKFCGLYLKHNEFCRHLKIFLHNEFIEKAGNYLAAIWIGDISGLPHSFSAKNFMFARDADNRPVYVVDRGILDACKGKDLDSNFVRCRMKAIFEATVGDIVPRSCKCG